MTEPAPRRRRPRWPLAIGAVLVLAAGLVAGGAIVTVTGISADEQVRVVPSPSASPSPVSPLTEAGGGQGQVLIGPGCVRALDQVQTVYTDLQHLATAASNLDAAALDRIVRQLRDLRPKLADNLGDCHATVQLPGATPSPSPAG